MCLHTSPGEWWYSFSFTFIRKKYRSFSSFKRGKCGMPLNQQGGESWLELSAYWARWLPFQAPLGSLERVQCFANVWETSTLWGKEKLERKKRHENINILPLMPLQSQNSTKWSLALICVVLPYNKNLLSIQNFPESSVSDEDDKSTWCLLSSLALCRG